MTTIEPGTLLRPAPPKTEWDRSRIGQFLLGVERKTGRDFGTY